jgi:DNA-binding response OmpR family regulator
MTRRARIIVAEDEEELLAQVVSALEVRGFEVTRAVDGVELLEHLAADAPFDLVITDVSMPWQSGVQVMTSTRYAGMLDVPVIVITALRSPEIPVQVKRLGRQTALLHKPFSLEALQAAVDVALADNPALRAG